METDAHQQLKRLGAAFLLHAGAAAVAVEARCPIQSYRLDVAGYFDRPPTLLDRPATTAASPSPGPQIPPPRRVAKAPIDPRTAVIECKQARADFLRDRRDQLALISQRQTLLERKTWLENQHIKPREPHLRQSGGFLFPECEEWDFASTKLAAWHHTVDRLERLDERLHGETKFSRIARYALADRLYLLTPAGLLTRRDLPAGWGLLECPVRWLTASDDELASLPESPIRVAVDAPMHPAREVRRTRLLRNIAAVSSRRLLADLPMPGSAVTPTDEPDQRIAT